MTRFLSFLKSSLIGGLAFMLPLVVLAILFREGLGILRRLINPLLPLFSHLPGGGFLTATLVEIGIIAVICLFAGWAAETAYGKRFYAWLESGLLQFIPGYSMVRSFLFSFSGKREKSNVDVVLARIEDAWQVAFLMDRLDNGLLAVFVPEVPSGFSGSLYLLTPDRVQQVDVPAHRAYATLRRFGAGSGALLNRAMGGTQ